MNIEHKAKISKSKAEEPENSTDKETVFFGFSRVKAEEKGRLVRDHFDSIARQYDFMNTLLSFGIHHIWKHSAIRMLGLKQGDKVIDVCGGTADLSIIAGNAVGPSGQVFVYDINNAMMEAGSNKVTSASMSDLIKFVQGDAEQISFRDGYFDAAMVGFGIRNLTKIENGLKEICRVLKPNGKFMCLEFSRPTSSFFRFFYNIYSFYVMPLIGKLFTGYKQAYTYLPESIRTFPLPDQLSSMLEQAGFCNVNYTKCTNGIAVIHFGTKK